MQRALAPAGAAAARESLGARLAAVTGDARRLAHDLRRIAGARRDCQDHPLIVEIARRADRREVLDPAFARALNWVAAAIDRSLAAAVAPPVADAVHDRHTDDVEPLRALRRRAIALGVAIDDVLDAVMAEEAIREARSFPFRG